MTEYRVVRDGAPGFAVEIICSDGAHSLRGFRTEAAVLEWIADQEFRAANAEAVEISANISLRGSEDRTCRIVRAIGPVNLSFRFPWQGPMDVAACENRTASS